MAGLVWIASRVPVKRGGSNLPGCPAGFYLTLAAHWNFHAVLFCERLRFPVSCVHVADDTHPGIGSQDPLNTFGHHLAAVRDGHLPRVQRIANSHPATIVNGNP